MVLTLYGQLESKAHKEQCKAQRLYGWQGGVKQNPNTQMVKGVGNCSVNKI